MPMQCLPYNINNEVQKFCYDDLVVTACVPGVCGAGCQAWPAPAAWQHPCTGLGSLGTKLMFG